MLQEKQKEKERVPNLFELREKLLMKDYPYEVLEEPQNVTIGLPKVLFYWETMPFWRTFWRALGFSIKVSPDSTRKIYEDGLSAVTSDTVCFPAKLVHGHIRALAKSGVNRIFMPSITTVSSENTEETSQSMCAIVKGYPIVIRNSDNPEKRWGIPFDAPLFHWYTPADRDRQLTRYMEETFQLDEEVVNMPSPRRMPLRRRLRTSCSRPEKMSVRRFSERVLTPLCLLPVRIRMTPWSIMICRRCSPASAFRY